MLVYGDHEQEVVPARCLQELASDEGRWLDHDRLRARFITLAGLAQAVADRDFRAAGIDRRRAAEDALLNALMDQAGALMHSWDLGCPGALAPPIPPIPVLPDNVLVRLPEGYAFYALYPEAYGLAARMLALEARPRLIGLRSIGAGLAAIAAAALGAPRPVTLRPTGDPFRRELRLDEGLAAELLEGPAHYVIVDEGPGLSGSSFGCVADWLEARGVPRDRIAFLPGHDGDLGPEADAAHCARWAKAQRPVARIDGLRSWVEQLTGPIDRWDDLFAGAWRPRWSADERSWPPVTPAWERAKFLVRADGVEWLVRFAGLGSIGEGKLALARLLHRTGFGPEVAGLTHGWLVQRWHAEASPTQPTLDELASYLALRATLPAGPGASLAELVTMVRRNVPALSRWNPPADVLQARVRPVTIDGRLAAHEWLRLPSGQLLKADALDHHQAHDLVGCQDLAWDVAAAAIELDLARSEVTALEKLLGCDPELLAFYRIAYAAFRLGAHRMSEAMVGSDEAARHRAAAHRFELALVDGVEDPCDLDQPLCLGVERRA
ncbi:hypothetical protein GCM10022280_06490 [Sphingomonas swuensis]|uniref:Cell division protein FtsK n=1 Tax=Sphingomonas swuensis TaxID=977800 RepID=A0ABP7SGR3_9SPHN